MPDDRLEAIQHNLIMLGVIESSPESPQNYHPELVDSIVEFQKKRGLEPDGIIGTNTIAALNTPISELIMAIEVNLARWRWHAHNLGRNYIMVNIADFTLKAVRNDQVQLDMPVIVGKLQHQTPVFSDTIRYLDFNPFWNVPPSIAMNEYLPELRKNPRHLVERHIRLFSSWSSDAVEIDSTSIDWQTISRSQMARYKLRQDPGPWNALGSVKFVFPNHYSVYLHDTPAHDLFSQTSRSFSHGCIRVSKPLDLARFSLDENGAEWSLERIEQIVALGERKILRISPPLAVHVTYQTVWVDNERNIYFNSDIYGRDAKLIKVLVN
jgi:murein L,D-transpeptidase YcbB/YkuD